MATLWVRHSATSAAVVRNSIAESLRSAGVSDADLFDATVLASELLGNAVQHAPPLPTGHLRVDWSLDGTTYRVSVTDGGGIDALAVKRPGTTETSGRGLSIIAAISDEWGVRTAEGQSTVWASSTLASAEAPAEPHRILTTH